MSIADEILNCMVSLDVERAKQIWAVAYPHLEPIKSDADMLMTLHLARTASPLVNDRLRFYSHCWLTERELPSMLPDELRPAAYRMYPRVVSSVGIAVGAKSELYRPIVPHVRGAMEGVVLEMYADGKQDETELIKRRMLEARRTTVRKLLGV